MQHNFKNQPAIGGECQKTHEKTSIQKRQQQNVNKHYVFFTIIGAKVSKTLWFFTIPETTFLIDFNENVNKHYGFSPSSDAKRGRHVGTIFPIWEWRLGPVTPHPPSLGLPPPITPAGSFINKPPLA